MRVLVMHRPHINNKQFHSNDIFALVTLKGSTDQYSPFRDQITYISKFPVPEGGGNIDSDAMNGRYDFKS